MGLFDSLKVLHRGFSALYILSSPASDNVHCSRDHTAVDIKPRRDSVSHARLVIVRVRSKTTDLKRLDYTFIQNGLGLLFRRASHGIKQISINVLVVHIFEVDGFDRRNGPTFHFLRLLKSCENFRTLFATQLKLEHALELTIPARGCTIPRQDRDLFASMTSLQASLRIPSELDVNVVAL